MRLLEFTKLVLPDYCPDWYQALIAEYLERCAADDPEVQNLIVAAPPGSGKSQEVSILFPAWLLSHHPEQHIIGLSNSDSLARLMSGNVLRLLNHPELQERFPLKFLKESEAQFTIDGGDGRPSLHAAGIMGQLTGHRANFLVFDDLLKSQQEAYSEVIRDRVWNNLLSAGETRLLPGGKVVGIGTRWHQADPTGRLLQRAQESPVARQFIYLNLAAWNSGEDSFVLNTRTGKKTYIRKYRSLAKITGQPYSFSRAQLEEKKADLGPSRFSSLYMGQPLSGEDQFFPENVWKSIDPVPVSEISLIISAWDCASKTASHNDYSANVVIARLNSGRFVVLDVWKSRLNFSQLPQVALERYESLCYQYGHLPVLCIEDANAGTQLIDLFEDRLPNIPVVRAKAVHSKIIRAEGVTPFTTGGLVSLPKDAIWREQFISELANFPVGQHDDLVDAFCHAIKAFTALRSLHAPDLKVLPGPIEDPYEQEIQERLEDEEYRQDCGDLSSWDRGR
jgi:predicted phage terminase large subunit-like protein